MTSLLVLGGARSGKSRFAQACAESSGRALTFVATAQAYDREMKARIAHHAAARDARWRVVEAPFALPETVNQNAGPSGLLLIDCMTLWLSNIMLRGDDVDAATRAMATVIAKLQGPAIFVSNEVGAGIVPDNALARRFRDAQGQLNQVLAQACQTVFLVTAGLPLRLKPAAPIDVSF